MYADVSPLLQLRFNNVRELYTELFLLLDQSIREEPVHGRGSLDRTIEELMHTIEQEMSQLREEIERARAEQTDPRQLDEAVMTFDAELRKGLTVLNECVTRRIAQLSEARETLKQRLQTVQAKKRGARGYRGGHAASRLLESHA